MAGGNIGPWIILSCPWRTSPPSWCILKIILVPKLTPSFIVTSCVLESYAINIHKGHPRPWQPISSSLGSHCGPRPFAYVNVATNDPSQVLPATNDPFSGEDEPFGQSRHIMNQTNNSTNCKLNSKQHDNVTCHDNTQRHVYASHDLVYRHDWWMVVKLDLISCE